MIGLNYKKIKQPYYLRRGILIVVSMISTKIYNFIMHWMEFIISTLWINSVFVFVKKKPARERPLVLICRNNFYGISDKEVSTEKFMLDDTIGDIGVDADLFFWDDEASIIGNQMLWCKTVVNMVPDIVIMSSYNQNNFTQPRLFLLKKIRKKYDIKFVGLWWDTCSDNFLHSIHQYIEGMDLQAIMDNPMMDFGGTVLSNNDAKKVIPLCSPINGKLFKQKEKNIDVAFLGQLSSYRSYRKEALFYVMKNNIAGFYSGFERESQPLHEEYFDILARAKIGINFSYSVDKHQLKGRVLDTMMSGALLLEQKNNQIECYFKDGEDYVSFTSKEDLVKKIKYFLQNDAERVAIAERGRKKCMKVTDGRTFWNKIIEIKN